MPAHGRRGAAKQTTGAGRRATETDTIAQSVKSKAQYSLFFCSTEKGCCIGCRTKIAPRASAGAGRGLQPGRAKPAPSAGRSLRPVRAEAYNRRGARPTARASQACTQCRPQPTSSAGRSLRPARAAAYSQGEPSWHPVRAAAYVHTGCQPTVGAGPLNRPREPGDVQLKQIQLPSL